MVILPELGGHNEFTYSARLNTLEKKGHLGSTEYVIKKPSNEICAADARLSGMLEEWQADQCYERFCNLYVALTRAKHATYCILDPVDEAKWTPKQKYDDWIREATASFPEFELELAGGEYKILYQSGDWLPAKGQKSAGKGEQAEAQALPPAAPRMERKIASKIKKQSPGDLLTAGKGMRFGNIVHAHFEKITWLDEMPALDDHTAARLVRDCLQSDSVRPHFQRPAGEHRLLREQPFETRQDGRWSSGVIDRAVIHYHGGQPQSIDIIDFKTDADKSPAQLRSRYQPQLQTYRAAMHTITGVPEENIRCFLLSTASREMVEV